LRFSPYEPSLAGFLLPYLSGLSSTGSRRQTNPQVPFRTNLAQAQVISMYTRSFFSSLLHRFIIAPTPTHPTAAAAAAAAMDTAAPPKQKGRSWLKVLQIVTGTVFVLLFWAAFVISHSAIFAGLPIESDYLPVATDCHCNTTSDSRTLEPPQVNHYNTTVHDYIDNDLQGGLSDLDLVFIKNPLARKQHPLAKATIAFAVTITGCGGETMNEGAAVLHYSIYRASIHGHLGGQYDYQMFAFYHPNASACALPLRELGYNVLERETFMNVSDLPEGDLKTYIQKDGCCGEKEFIKFEAYTLTDYPVVVHLDLDILVLKPLDILFDPMVEPDKHRLNCSVMEDPKKIPPERINAMFTLDYNIVHPKIKVRPVQGGFLLARPNMTVYEEIRAIVQSGHFTFGRGWGDATSRFYGYMTFQGVLPYYYHILHPGEFVELNHCIFNCQAENAYDQKPIPNTTIYPCMNGKETCDDCRLRPIRDIYFAHFTLCQKPWWCVHHAEGPIRTTLCNHLTAAWYQARSELERAWGRSARGPHSHRVEQFYGFCRNGLESGYTPIEQPYGALSYSYQSK
jgi:hypothetical protein